MVLDRSVRMNEQDVLGAFLLVNNPIVLSEEETKDVQKAIKQLQQRNQQLKIQISAREEEYKKLEDNWNKLKEYIDIKLYNVEYLQKLCGCRIDDVNHLMLKIIKNKIKELERSDSNE